MSLDTTKFAASIKTMIGVNKQAFDKNPTRGSAFVSSYTKTEAKDIVDRGDISQLISLSQFYWYVSGIYRNLLAYYATMPTYASILSPRFTGAPDKANSNKLTDKYYKALNFVDNINISSEFSRITYLLLLNGAYYGLFRDYGGRNVVIQDLPVEYCRTRFKNVYKNNILEFDMDYFRKGITDKVKRDEALETFPAAFTPAYNAYIKDPLQRWFQVPEEIGIAFFYLDQKPMLVSAVPGIIDLTDYRDLEKETDKQNLQKIMTQQIPFDKDTKEPVLELEEMVEMHKGAVGMLANTPNVDVLTTFADIKLHTLQDSKQVMKDNLEKMERSVYVDAGVSQNIFNATGNLSLGTSIQNDEGKIFDILKLYANYINYQINSRFEDSKFYWELTILPITQYNKKEMHEIYLKNAQFGYSKFLPAIAAGMKQSELFGTTKIENDVLSIMDFLEPLKSTHTETGNAAEGGAPTKPVEDKKPNTLEHEDGN